MIYIFRKEMKKWNNVLWVVVASLGVGAGSAIFLGTRSMSDMKVAHVNGAPVYYEQFKRSLLTIQQQIDSLRPLAKAYGLPEDVFLSMFFGGQNPQSMALDTCVKEKLLDGVQSDFSLAIDDAWFKKELIKQLSQYNITDASGRVNMAAYQALLQRMATNPATFESLKREEMKRDIVSKFVKSAAYVPQFVAREIFEQENAKKKFAIISIPKSFFDAKFSKNSLDKKEVENFYFVHKDDFMLPEQRDAQYLTIDTSKLSAAVDVDPVTVKNFYEKNKSSLYRIAPQVSVRKIFIKKNEKDAENLAKKIHGEAVAAPAQFAALAKKYSQDSATAQQGGLVSSFAKGTYNTEFEQAAFRLQNPMDISPVVKTQSGYEIIQLVERSAASEKPFDAVKDEITKTLKTKRTESAVKSQLDALMRNIKENPKALAEFASQHGASLQSTGLIDGSSVGQEQGVKAGVVRQVFSPHKQEKSAGYFPFENQFVIYQVKKIVKSHLPHFEDIESKVQDAYLKERSAALAKNALTEVRSQLLNKKMTLEEVASKFGGSLNTTDAATKPADLKGDLDRSVKDRLFALTDTQQVLFVDSGEKYYLAKIISIELDSALSAGAAQEKIIKQEKYKTEGQLASAFIASLHRNAKIEVDTRVLQVKPSDEKD